MAFYGIGNLFGNVVRQEAREKEKAREAEDKKAEQEEATQKKEATQAQQALDTEVSAQAEAQRERLLQLQEKVARRLEDFVRASGREKPSNPDAESEALSRQLENEQDSFTPENLQRLRQLSQNAKGALQGAQDSRQGSRPEETTARPQKADPNPAQDLELQGRRASQELKENLRHTEGQVTGQAQQEAREAGRDTSTDTRSQKAQETNRPQQDAADQAKARPEKGSDAPKPEAPRSEPTRGQSARPEAPKAELPKPEAPKAELPKPEAPKAELPKSEAPKAELPRPEAPKAELPRPEAPKAELPRPEAPKAELPKPEPSAHESAATAEPEPPRPPRPEILRARGEGAQSRTAEPRSEAKAPEGQPTAEGQEAPAHSRSAGTPSRFAAAQRPETGAFRPGQAPEDQPQAARPENARRTTPESSTEGAARSGPAPEGPRTARGQETAGGAGVSTGGSSHEKSQARLGDSRFAPHLEARQAEGQKSQAPKAPQGDQGGERAGKASQGSSSKGQSTFSTMGLGLGSLGGGSSGLGFLRPGLISGGQPEGSKHPPQKAGGSESADQPSGNPVVRGGADVSTLGGGLGGIRPTVPEPILLRPQTPPPAPEPEPPGRPGTPLPAENPRDTLDLDLPPRVQVGGPISGPGPRRTLELPRANAPAPRASEPTSNSAGQGSVASSAPPAEGGPGLLSIPSVGAPVRQFPGLTPRPVGGPVPGSPQSPASPERLRLQPQRGEMPGEVNPSPSNQNTPRSVQLGGIRIPAPDGKDESSRRNSDPTEEIGIDSVDSVGPRTMPAARLTPRPGMHTPVQGPRGPRQERGPVGRVDGWQPEDPRSEGSAARRPGAGAQSPADDQLGATSIPSLGPSGGYRPTERLSLVDRRPGLPERGDQRAAASPGGETLGGRSMPTVGTPRPSHLPVFRGPGSIDWADHPYPTAPHQSGPELPGAERQGSGQFQLNLESLRRSPFRSRNDIVPEPEAPDQPVRPFAPLPKGDWGASRKPVGPASPGTDGTAAGKVPGARPGPATPGDSSQPRIELLRPRPQGLQGRLLTPANPRPEAASPEPVLRPGTHTPAAHLANGTEQARMAARIMSGDTRFVATGAGYAGRLPDPALPAEFRGTLAKAQMDGIEGGSALRSTLPRGPLTGGRPVVSQIPIYQPVLDLIYQIRGKAKVEAESSPITMSLSGSVGTLERQTYVRRELPVAPRESPDSGHQKVQTASDQNPILGAMTASMRGSAEPARKDAPTGAKVEASAARAEATSQKVVETGERSGGGSRGGATGNDGGQSGQGSQGDQGEATSPGSLSSLQTRYRMQTLQASANHEAFRLSMTRLDGPAGAQQRAEMAARHASTSIPSLLKRIYRSQDLEELDETEAVNGLAMMLKLSGEFTYDHSARVLEFALDLAEELGVKDEKVRRQVELGAMFKDIGEAGLLMAREGEEKQDEIARFMSSQDMRRAGLLHDIGKLQIPRSILYKPGRMTDEEYEQMKMHPLYGEQMVYPILSLRHLCPTIRGHHERWDGKGYPDGLKGEKIPLPARILAVVDVFDALRAERPYKASMDMEQVRQILAEGKGTHFDPDCVEAFLRVLERRFPQAARRRSHRARPVEKTEA